MIKFNNLPDTCVNIVLGYTTVTLINWSWITAMRKKKKKNVLVSLLIIKKIKKLILVITRLQLDFFRVFSGQMLVNEQHQYLAAKVVSHSILKKEMMGKIRTDLFVLTPRFINKNLNVVI